MSCKLLGHDTMKEMKMKIMHKVMLDRLKRLDACRNVEL